MIKFSPPIVVNLFTILAVVRVGLCGDVQTEFETKYGKLKGEVAEGYKDKKVVVLRGVPFAKPPIGDLRWKKPAELEKFPSDPYEATKNAPLCIQMMSKKMQEKFKDEMNGAENKKETDIMSENVDGEFG